MIEIRVLYQPILMTVPLTPKLYLYNGETEFGPETEKMDELNMDIKEGVDACKADLTVKNIQN